MRYPLYCCQLCGKPIGLLGRLFQVIGGGFHQNDCEPPKARKATP